MSTTIRHSRNKHGDPVMTIRVVGWHDIFRLQWNLLHAQVEFHALARQTFRWMRRSMGPSRFRQIDQSLTGGKVERWSK